MGRKSLAGPGYFLRYVQSQLWLLKSMNEVNQLEEKGLSHTMNN